MRLDVQTFDTGCTDKEQAVKVLEEAAEVFGAWQYVSQFNPLGMMLNANRLADEIADVIMAACNLAARYGIDLDAAMLRCHERNHRRGRC